MLSIHKKTNFPLVTLLLASYLSLVLYNALPYGHNMQADLAAPLQKSFIVLNRPHNHSQDLSCPIFEYYDFETFKITPCSICAIFSLSRSKPEIARTITPDNHCFLLLPASKSVYLDFTITLLPDDRAPPLMAATIL